MEEKVTHGTFKKTAEYATIVRSNIDKNIFPIGFKYSLGNETYEVVKIESDVNSQSRMLLNKNGQLSSLSVESIARDLQSPTSKVLAESSKDATEKSQKQEQEIKDSLAALLEETPDAPTVYK